MEIFDTHFHLTDVEPVTAVLDLLPEEHTFYLMAMGGSLQSTIRAMSFAEAVENAWFAAGVHPHDADNPGEEVKNFLQFAGHPKLKAIGELGLDFYYEMSNRENQFRTLDAFLNLALSWDLPAVIHCRDKDDSVEAYDLCYERLQQFAGQGGRFVVHCYTGLPEYAEKFLSLGGYLGVTGMVTFRRADNVRELLKMIPAERLLLETDSPYLAPIPFRGKENHPGHMVEIVTFAAEVLGKTPDELAVETLENGKRLFQI